MNEKWRPWLIALVVVVSIFGWQWWKNENPRLLAGDYRCTGRVDHPNGSSSAIDGAAGVTSEGKIEIGSTGMDIAIGRRVLTWGKIEKTSSFEFFVELTPSAEIAEEVPNPFWVTCSRK